MKKRFIELRIPREDAELWIVNALLPTALSNAMVRKLQEEQTAFDENEAHEKSLAEVRAKRAEAHTLTQRQAEALCAAKWGKSPSSYRPIPKRFSETGYEWEYVRSMGGASYRMIDTLIEEGLIMPNRMSLTDAGRIRIEAWEAKHGALYSE